MSTTVRPINTDTISIKTFNSFLDRILERPLIDWDCSRMTTEEKKDLVTCLTQYIREQRSNKFLNAIISLRALGKDAQQAIPILLNKEFNRYFPHVKTEILITLEKIGAEAKDIVPLAINHLERWTLGFKSDCDKELTKTSLEVIGRFGKEGKDAVPKLIELSKDSDSTIKHRAINTLGLIGPDAQKAANSLIAYSLSNEDPAFLRTTIDTLGKIQAVESIPVLIGFLNNKNKYTLFSAIEALGSIGPSANEAIDPLSKLLKHEDHNVRADAIEAIGKIGGKEAASILQEELKVSSSPKYLIVKALGLLKQDAEKAIPHLIATGLEHFTGNPILYNTYPGYTNLKETVLGAISEIKPDLKDKVASLFEDLERIKDS